MGERATYVSVTRRDRLRTIMLVLCLYGCALFLLLTWRPPMPLLTAERHPMLVELLPLIEPPPVEMKKPEPPGNITPTPVAPSPRDAQRNTAAPVAAPIITPPVLMRPDVTVSTLAPPLLSSDVGDHVAIDTGGAALTGDGSGESGNAGDLGGGGGGGGLAAPYWVRKVRDEELFALMDRALLLRPFDVEFRMRCAIAISQRVKCRVLKEWPYHRGLRRAVMAAIPLMRLATAQRNGRPIDGHVVEFSWRVIYPGQIVAR